MSVRRSTPLFHLVVALLLVFYLLTGIDTEIQRIERGGDSGISFQDYRYYQRALSDALAGRDPYAIRAIGPGFLYPPPAMLFLEPFALLLYFDWQIGVYSLVSAILLGVICLGLARHYHLTLAQTWYWYPLAFGFAPFYESLGVGQINLLTAFGIYLMFISEANRPWLAGLGLGAAIVTKVSPALYLVYLAVRQSWRALAASLLAILVFVFVGLARYGPTPFQTYTQVFAGMLNEFPGGEISQSLSAKLTVTGAPQFQTALFYLPASWQTPVVRLAAFFSEHTPGVQRAYAIYLALMVTGSAGIAWLLRQREELFIVASLAMVFSPNILWYHHYVLLLVPLFVWMAWQQLKPAVVLWCIIWLLVMQVDRWRLTRGLLVHLFGQVSIWLLLVWQMNEFFRWQRARRLELKDAQTGY